jgi:hypothetical protein
VHGAKGPPSELHSKRAAESFEVNAKVATGVETIAAGACVIVVSTSRIVQVRLAGVASVFPAASVARTWNVCEPTASPEYAAGDVQAANAPPSSAHANDEPPSLDVNDNVAPCANVVAAGALVIVVSGASVSTVQVRDAGVGSTLPAPSFARTRNVCDPCASDE